MSTIEISKESELHHSIGSLIDGAHPGPETDRDYLGTIITTLNLHKSMGYLQACG